LRINVPAGEVGRGHAGQLGVHQPRPVQVAVRVGLVLAQEVLRLERPVGVDARLLRDLDGLAESLGGLVLERQRLSLERAAVQLLLLGIQAARRGRVQEPLVEVAVCLADPLEGRRAPRRVANATTSA